MDLKTLTLIEDPADGDEPDNTEEEFERILRESEAGGGGQ